MTTDLVEQALGYPQGPLDHTLGIRVIELSAAHSRAVMPVAGNTQVTGRVHGGAYAALAETIASLSASVHAGAGRVALGTELTASHVGGTDTGEVHADCRAVSLGRRLTVHQVDLRADDGTLLSSIRVTNYLARTPS
ncbi:MULTISPECIES: PaaI family thioesterase [unclassified Gordonia (in: high G+C Gram-positive bacteria)]|uniref:PaaI family thioesterase n=1 Tax=unclassified Gordonia (in: high G+C Gram-positive bacteria) TaxID=2657482 RepID=UPI001556229C|nr:MULTISPECIES: PaaI family thioesterase [unclassified Gordonia (in: high G+C Gram-positive bacteria)]MDF3280779.1 PaaI family thioesterase [Gordonia sp. N1V]